MRLKILLLLCSVGTLAASPMYSQYAKYDVAYKDASLVSVLEDIKTRTGYHFFYLEGVNVKDVNISATLDQASIDEILQEVLVKNGFTYKIENQIISVGRAKSTQAPAKQPVMARGRVTDSDGKPIAGVTVLVKGAYSGTSSDANGNFVVRVPEPEGAVLQFSFIGKQSVEIKFKQGEEIKVTLRDEVQQVNQVDVISTGYGDIDRRRSTAAVTTLDMEDLNVPGLATVDQMLEGRVPGMIFMQNSGQVGAAPKLRVRGTSTILGNQEPVWVLDGVILTDPVNVDPADINNLDFVNLLGNAISGLNPDDIEQIDVLKDAAATAIYGTKAGNGVIVITTKKGKVGPPRISYSFSGTFTERPHYSDREIYLMNSKERVDVSREMFERGMEFRSNTGMMNWIGYEAAVMDYKEGRISFSEYQDKVRYYETVNTDWFDILTKNSFSQKHTVSVSGGSPHIRYYASVGAADNQGVIRGESNKSYTTQIKLNGDYNKFTYQLSVQGNIGKRRYTPTQGDVNIIQYAYETSRAIPAYNEDGSQWFYDRGSSYEFYPFSMLNEMNTTHENVDSHSVIATANVKYNVIRNLSVEGTFSYSISNTSHETIFEEGSYYIAKLKKGGPGDPLSDCPWGGEYNNTETKNNSYTTRLQVNYSALLDQAGKHSLSASVIGELSSSKYNSLKEKHRGYYPERGKTFVKTDPSLLLPIYDSEGKVESDPYKNWRQWLASNVPTIANNLTNKVSAIVTATYVYDNRYILNFNARVDGSNKFGQRKNNRFLPIWSVSGRWNITNDFFKESNFLNELALKVSYGLQGNTPEQPTRMTIKKGGYDTAMESFISTVGHFPNPDLTWETKHSFNTGLDFSIWKNKIYGNVNYFYSKTVDAFVNINVSDINGVATYNMNRASIMNQGFEVNLQFMAINSPVGSNGKRGFSWRIDPQIGQVVNKLLNKAVQGKTSTLNDDIRYTNFLNGTAEIAGKPLNSFYSYRFKGLSPVDGSPIFYGTEAELQEELHALYSGMSYEEVCLAVMTPSGTRVPVLQGGVSNNFGYRQFSLSFNFTYSFGNKVRLLKLCSNNNIQPYPEKNVRKEFVNRWRKPGDEDFTNIPGFKTSSSAVAPWWSSTSGAYQFADSNIYGMYDLSDIRVVKGDYLKLQTVSFRYNVHESLCKKLGLSSAYISLSGTNLFTIASKDLKGQDVTQSGTAPTVNLSIRPTYSMSVNITF